MSPRTRRTSHSRLFGILSLIGGALGIVVSWAGWGIILPIAAIVLGIIAARREKRPRAFWLTGLLLGVVGLVVSLVSLFLQYLSIMAAIGLNAG